MIARFISILFLVCLFSRCVTLGEEDLIDTKILAQINDETFLYKVYKIDFDAFIIKFKVVANKDSSDIFEIYISDGVYSDNSFHTRISNDTLFISDPRQSGINYYSSKKGTIVKHFKP